ncbi:MAG: hypothetical protein JNK89_01840 [Saprospiraceae bacterium]|nr:hypothetical protein [Saprospiraceae bacterium]
MRLFYLFLLALPAVVRGQLTSIETFKPENVEALQPLRAHTPNVVACAGGYCFSYSSLAGALILT